MSGLITRAINKIKVVWPNLVYLKHKKTVRTLYRILRPYYILRNAWPFWFYGANREARKLHERNRMQLSDPQQRLVREMKENGIAATHIDELFPNQNLLPQLQAYARGLMDNGQQRQKGKTYITDLLERMQIADLNNPFIKFTLSPTITAIANGYMDMYSKFFMYSLNLVSPVGNAEPISSQRWHRDPEDKKLFKVFIYLGDVDEEAGPFSYLTKSQYGGRWGNKFPQRPPQGYIDIKEGAIEKFASKEDVRVATGKAGTVIFCDTAGIHRGGYAKSKQRLMFTGGFCSTASLWLPKFIYPENSEVEKLPAGTVRYALQPWYAGSVKTRVL